MDLDDFVIVTNDMEDSMESSPPEQIKGTDEEETNPNIYYMLIECNIANRFAHTVISSKVRNTSNAAKEATFSVILPSSAFISEFVMVIGGKSYKAYVKEKEEAKDIYDKAVARGAGAAHVAVSARESNSFTVSTNIEAESEAVFLLTYEELLRRKHNAYELIINIHPKQPVKDLHVNVTIDELRPLKFVKTPAIRSGNEIIKADGDLDPRSDIQITNSTHAVVKFGPNIERQNELARNLGTDVSGGLCGQFVVQYDIERDPNGGEVLIRDGYFVHFFAPSDIKSLNKFVVFVLDTSSSMHGQKIGQLKEAMKTILSQLNNKDYFNVISFASEIRIWDTNNPTDSVDIRYRWHPTDHDELALTNTAFPKAASAISENIKKGQDSISLMRAVGGTNINEALEVALTLIEREIESSAHQNLPQPMIMFLTDGEPTTGITSTDEIVERITRKNTARVPIYSLSFGDYADKNFLKKLSIRNFGFSRHIYEAADAALQLRNFYKEIASPVLSNVKFDYILETTNVTKTEFPIHFDGSEIVVTGQIDNQTFPEVPKVLCTGACGCVVLSSVIQRPVTSLERLWAYLTIQQLLDDAETAEYKQRNEKKALDLALKYSFVTPVSSLVVVKPDSTDTSVNAEAADSKRFSPAFMAPTATFSRSFPSAVNRGNIFGHVQTAVSSSTAFMAPTAIFSQNFSAYAPASGGNLFGQDQAADSSIYSPASAQKYSAFMGPTDMCSQSFSSSTGGCGGILFGQACAYGQAPGQSRKMKKAKIASSNFGNVPAVSAFTPQNPQPQHLFVSSIALPWLVDLLNADGTLKSPNGFGYQAALDLAMRGIRVILMSRNEKEAEEFQRKIKGASNSDKLVIKVIDMESAESMREFADDISTTEERLNILANIDGTLLTDQQGLETSHLSSIFLTVLLKDSFDIKRLNKYPHEVESWAETVLFTNKKLFVIVLTAVDLGRGPIKTQVGHSLTGFFKLLLSILQNVFYTKIKESGQTLLYDEFSKDVKRISQQILGDCERTKLYEVVSDAMLVQNL